jgi:hypothetical protein
MTLHWKASQPVTTAYTVLLHVVDDSGEVVAQADGPPSGGMRPTTSWRADEVISDERTVVSVSALQPGEYTLLTGLYVPTAEMPRLPVLQNGSWRGDSRVLLGTIEIE